MRISFSTYELLAQSRSGFCKTCQCVTVPGKSGRKDRDALCVPPVVDHWTCSVCKQPTLCGIEAARNNGGLQIGA